jgi:Arc/MetJ-type ribon-helix-helix transcriptional regulator
VRRRPIDLPRVRHGLARLDALLAAHPELRAPAAQARLSAWLAQESRQVMTKHTGKQIFVRLSEDLVAELDRYVEVLAREQPGLNPSRSDAIRVLLHKGLATIQAPEATPGPADPATSRARRPRARHP